MAGWLTSPASVVVWFLKALTCAARRVNGSGLRRPMSTWWYGTVGPPGDGVAEDSVAFNSGAVAEIGIAPVKARLLWA